MKLNHKVLAAAIATVGCVAVLVASNMTSVASAGDKKGNEHNHSDTSSSSNSQSKLKILGDDCDKSKLKAHNGFQSDKAQCVDTEFGEVSAFEDNPTLLITKFPTEVGKGEDITLEVSTRNLKRDRFLAAGDGGYYLESAFLNKDGLTRGHFHTGCRLIGDGTEAPSPFRLGDRFVATEDGKGSSKPDTVSITIPGFDETGNVQCASWAGDGSHRIPMMSFANEIPAFDAVRITVE